MENYRVVIIAPENNPHVAAFKELAVALVDAIRENGFDCDLKLNELNPHAINIILGFHLLQSNIPSGFRYIVYQLEQLSETEGWMVHRPHMLDLLKGAEAVWDFSEENVQFLEKRGIPTSFIPVGYSQALETVPDIEKDIDVLFYGSRNERRERILLELLNRGFVVKALFGIYGEERDHWIGRAKLLINIHFYEANLFESVRVSYPVNNGVPVLSESSPTFPWPKVPLLQVSYEDLVDRVTELLDNPVKLSEYGLDCQKMFRTYHSMKELVCPLLNSEK